MVAKRLELQKSYKPLAPQERFHRSLARIRAYGGAMGGGKSRAICEECFRLAMEYPGLPVLIGRQRHTSIIETTRKTMFDHVIPVELLEHCRIKTSAGEDFIEFPNRSVIHFIGLEDPIKWFSSEIGVLAFDEAHEVLEDTVVKLMSRLRFPRAPVASSGDTGLVLIGFNPENPGHWLQRWMIVGSEQTEFGFRKNELWLEAPRARRATASGSIRAANASSTWTRSASTRTASSGRAGSATPPAPTRVWRSGCAARGAPSTCAPRGRSAFPGRTAGPRCHRKQRAPRARGAFGKRRSGSASTRTRAARCR